MPLLGYCTLILVSFGFSEKIDDGSQIVDCKLALC